MISITVTGRIGKDAETRNVGKDTVTSFSVASEQKVGTEKVTRWFDVSVWSKRGVALQPYLIKGTPVTVMGELTQKENNGKLYLGIRVEHVELQGGKRDANAATAPSRYNDFASDTGGSSSDEDSIPF